MGQEQEQSPVPSTVDDALTATAASFAIGGAALAIAFPPAAVALGVGAGATQLLQLVQRKWGKRLSQVAHGARERLGAEESDAARRLTEDEDLAALAYQAVDASMLSHHEEQARALGRVLGEALKAEPTVTIDDAAMVIEALRSLDLPHFRALAVFPAERSVAFSQLSDLIATRFGVDTIHTADVSGIVTGLQRAGVVEFAASSALRAKSLPLRLTPFGRRVLTYID